MIIMTVSQIIVTCAAIIAFYLSYSMYRLGDRPIAATGLSLIGFSFVLRNILAIFDIYMRHLWFFVEIAFLIGICAFTYSILKHNGK